MPADNPRIFISYSRKDGEDFATDLRDKLIAIFGEDQLWQDRAKMEGGVGWWTQIEEALTKVEFMVLVATPQAMQSPIVAKEWRRARQEGVCVYPVQVPGLPIDFDALPRWMADSHFYNLDKEWDTFVNYLKSPCTAVKVPFMPPPLPEHFVERPTEFNTLRSLLLDVDRQNPLAITTALKGAGGFGKTTLAAALCHDEAVQTAFDDGILWTTLGEQPDVVGALTKLYAALTGERPAFVDAEDAANNLADKLADRDCLIVIDDAWNTAHLRPFLRGGERCARLITTRIMDVALEAEAQPLTVDEMETGEAAQMLIAGIQPKPADAAPFRRLAQRLGEWPLALKLANGALRKRILRRDTPENAARSLEAELNAEGIQVLKSDTADQRSRSAGATLEITFQMLDENERIDLRRRFTTLGVFYEDTDIPMTALAALWGCDLREAERYATRLDDLSLLLRLDLESGTIRLHDVVRQYALSQLTDAPAQHNRLIDGWGDPYALPDTFAWTWYIYHLREAGRDPAERLLDFRWLRAKLFATNPNTLLADFDLALTPAVVIPYRVSESSTALPLLKSALGLAQHILTQDKSQFAAQLAGRLFSHNQNPNIAEFLESLQPPSKSLYPINAAHEQGGSALAIFAGHSSYVNGALALPDGRFLSWSDDNTLRLWANNGNTITILEGHSGSVSGALALPDGRFLSWSRDQSLRLWSSTGDPLTSLKGHSGSVSGALALSDGRFLSWSDDNTLRLWANNGDPLTSLKGHSGSVSGALALPDGRFLSWSTDHSLHLWANNGDPLTSLKGHSGSVSGALALSDGRFLSWAGRFRSTDTTLRLWSSDGHPLASLEGHSHRMSGALALSDGRFLSWAGGFASRDHTLRLWANNGNTITVLEGHSGSVSGALAIPDGRFLSWSQDNTLRLWSSDGHPLAFLEGHSGSVSGALPLFDGRFLSWSDDNTLRLWANNGDPLTSLKGHSGSVSGALAIPDGRFLSWSQDHTLHLWANNGDIITILEGHSGLVTGALALSDGRFLSWAGGLGSSDHTLRLWSSDGHPLASLKGHSGSVSGALALSDGRFLSWAGGFGSRDHTLRLWSSDGHLIASLIGHSHRVTSALALSDGRFLSWSTDHSLRLWSSDGHPLATLQGHSSSVSGAITLPDGRFLSWAGRLGSTDITLRLWSNASQPLATFYADAPITCCVLGQDGTIVAGDRQGRVLFLRLVE